LIKVGDRVAPFDRMSEIGVVVELIAIKNNEWFEVGNWVYKNWSIVNGLSFLPYNGGKYRLAPYEEIDEQKYIEKIKSMKKIDYTKLSDYEREDNTSGSKALACVGDNCEI